MPARTAPSPSPVLLPIGIAGMLVIFSETLTETANRAALAFRAALDGLCWPGVQETSTALTSVYVGFDPLEIDHDQITARLQALVDSRDWLTSPLPHNRRLWRIPAVFGGPLAPQLDEAAALAGVDPENAIAQITAAPVRVLTIGFAPGQPYLGTLPANWNIPRQTSLTRQVPIGALTVAISQLVLFTAATPTGWRHVAQTAFRGFRPDSDTPFALRPGDEVLFHKTDAETLARLTATDPDNGGAVSEALP